MREERESGRGAGERDREDPPWFAPPSRAPGAGFIDAMRWGLCAAKRRSRREAARCAPSSWNRSPRALRFRGRAMSFFSCACSAVVPRRCWTNSATSRSRPAQYPAPCAVARGTSSRRAAVARGSSLGPGWSASCANGGQHTSWSSPPSWVTTNTHILRTLTGLLGESTTVPKRYFAAAPETETATRPFRGARGGRSGAGTRMGCGVASHNRLAAEA